MPAAPIAAGILRFRLLEHRCRGAEEPNGQSARFGSVKATREATVSVRDLDTSHWQSTSFSRSGQSGPVRFQSPMPGAEQTSFPPVSCAEAEVLRGLFSDLPITINPVVADGATRLTVPSVDRAKRIVPGKSMREIGFTIRANR